MCEVHVYLRKAGSEEKILESVERVEVQGDLVTLKNIFGEEKKVQGKICLFDSSLQKILLEP
ncbi:MAG: CooT family nickel-binding protein, partial [Desulfohalobiaceae bacterium]|nr:CooT family nickel-binding protein [Desulfohalobiaceae bacterium]